jgi:hypothetical protein
VDRLILAAATTAQKRLKTSANGELWQIDGRPRAQHLGQVSRRQAKTTAGTFDVLAGHRARLDPLDRRPGARIEPRRRWSRELRAWLRFLRPK